MCWLVLSSVGFQLWQLLGAPSAPCEDPSGQPQHHFTSPHLISPYLTSIHITNLTHLAQQLPWKSHNPCVPLLDTPTNRDTDGHNLQMTLLTALGLRRKNDWEPLTLIDAILLSPLNLLVSIIYSIILFLRGRPFTPPRDKPAIRIVCLSDTHDRTDVDIPPGDLLIHAGDLTNAGTVADIQAQLDWLAAQPHQHKILVCGNHDSFFDPSARLPEDRGKSLDFKGIRYLIRDAVTLEFKGGRHLKIYGAPDIPTCGGSEMAFQYDCSSPPWTNTVPIDTDILITHTPPVSLISSHLTSFHFISSSPPAKTSSSNTNQKKTHLDLNLGCPALLQEVWRVRPKLHVFGHVHWGHGRQTVHFDDCQRAYEALMSRPPRGLFRDLFPHSGWRDALAVLGYGIHGVVWKWLMVGPGGNTSSLMVNAAQMYGNTGRLGNPVEVVDL